MKGAFIVAIADAMQQPAPDVVQPAQLKLAVPGAGPLTRVNFYKKWGIVLLGHLLKDLIDGAATHIAAELTQGFHALLSSKALCQKIGFARAEVKRNSSASVGLKNLMTSLSQVSGASSKVSDALSASVCRLAPKAGRVDDFCLVERLSGFCLAPNLLVTFGMSC